MERIAVVGLGYVGLPVALGFARRYPGTIGFDIHAERIAELREGHDRTGEISREELTAAGLQVTADPADLAEATFFIVAVPTPIDAHRRPDLTPLQKASETVGRVLKPGAVVVYESTVYPGVTEDVCGPILQRVSGLRQGVDFKLGYSPERINPGDPVHRLETIVKVVSGEDPETLERVARAYALVVDAGVHKAPTIQVAEAAKVIENAQRDLNIAFMNELAIIFERLGLRTADVLAAARTKWNFLPFTPGLVGGHCIGVDPYYLTTRAEEVGYHPEVLLAGRRINDGMGRHVARQVIKALNRAGVAASEARVGILGLTFKEDVPDTRNSRVPDIAEELIDFGAEALMHDPLADAPEVLAEWGITLCPFEELTDLHALILAVPHRRYRNLEPGDLFGRLRQGGVFYDVKSAVDPSALPGHIRYLSL